MRLNEKLRERTKQYASAVIRLYVSLPVSRKEVQLLGHQLLRSGTSVAAQIREASRARSDAEFCSKLDSALQEAGNLRFGWNCCAMIVASQQKSSRTC
jgi:four helix bundle protein